MGEEFRSVCKKMASHCHQFLSAVFGVEGEKSGQLIGSGIFMRLGGAELLLTAGHVADETRKYMACCHSAYSSASDTTLEQPWVCFAKPFDFAYTGLEANSIRESIHRFADSSVLCEDTSSIEDCPLMVLGYPGVKSRSSVLFSAVETTSLPFVSGFSKRVPKVHWFNPAFHIVIDYTYDSLQDESGNEMEFVDPRGLSGSAVWSFGRGSDSWTTAQAKIVGVATDWDPETNTLIGLRIEVIKSLILQQFRREFAYFRWINRGCPTNDELADWSASIEAIPNL